MKKNKLIAIILSVAIIGILGYMFATYYIDGKKENLSICLTEKRVVFYGAEWCPNCKLQKELFEKHFVNIDYVECSLDASLPQAEICDQKKISKYPTWIQNDDKKLTGIMRLETLAREFGCKY
jgi:thiol-disulfide isomerase/thioredoxin